MGRLDRYILTTAGGAFVAVLVGLTSMIWLSTALRRFDLITSQGQTFWVFMSVTGLTLPTLMVVTAPIALFVAIVYTLNKLNSDSELIVMSAAGVSPWHTFRAPLLLSVIIAVISAIVVADFSPRSLRMLRENLTKVNADIVTNVATPGRFMSIERGLTFHIRERAPGGILLGIFIHDSRTEGQTTTYIAERGRVVSSDAGAFLVLEEGTLQRSGGGRNSSIVAIERYAFDLTQADSSVAEELTHPSFKSLADLIWPPATPKIPDDEVGRHRVELHKRLSTPLYPIAAFVIAFAFLGAPRTTRQSRGMAITGAVTTFILVEMAGLGTGGFVERSAYAAPIPYIAPLAAIGLGTFMIIGGVEAKTPASFQRLADSITVRFERMAES